MAAIQSNGTGGGDWSAGATWNGGVAPGEGDTAQIVSGDTVTIDSTITVGDDTATPALDILNGGELDWDNLGDDVLTLKGDFYVRNGGALTLDGTGDGTKTLTIKLNYSAVLAAGKYGLITEDGAVIDCDGFNKTRSWDTLSANATSGQKVVVTTNDNSAVWEVGDEFVVGSMSQAQKAGAETDTIGSIVGTSITKAGANYSYAHEEDVALINLTRNVVFTSHDTSFKGYIYITNSVPGNIAFDWVEFSYLGSDAATKYGVTIAAGGLSDFAYCSLHRMYYGIARASGTVTISLTGCVFAFSVSRDLNNVYGDTSFTDSVFLGSDDRGADVYPAGFSGCHFGNCDDYGSAVRSTGTLSSCRFYGNGSRGVYNPAGVLFFDGCDFDNNALAIWTQKSITRLADCTFGAIVANTADFYVDGIMVGVDLNTVTLDVTIASGSADNRVSIHATGAAHKTWKAMGTYEKQSTIKRSGTYALLMSPTSATDTLIAESAVPASSGLQIVVSAYLRKNAAYGGANLPFVRLSGAGISATTDAMTDVDDTWQLLVVSGTPTEDGFAKVEFVTQSAGAGAAVYVDDVKMVYTIIDTGSMDFWYEGDLTPVLMTTGLGAVDVWDVLESQIDTSAVSMGRLVLKALRGIRRWL